MTATVTMRPDFKAKLESFFEGCQRIYAAHEARQNAALNLRFPNSTAKDDVTTWNMTWLQRYVRLETKSDTYNGVFVFVDIETGEVLKPAGWKRPAKTKTKRGNIFDEDNGLRYMGHYGVADANNIKRKPVITDCHEAGASYRGHEINKVDGSYVVTVDDMVVSTQPTRQAAFDWVDQILDAATREAAAQLEQPAEPVRRKKTPLSPADWHR